MNEAFARVAIISIPMAVRVKDEHEAIMSALTYAEAARTSAQNHLASLIAADTDLDEEQKGKVLEMMPNVFAVLAPSIMLVPQEILEGG